MLLSDQNQHHVSKGQIIDVDLSKLSNLGTYQEIGKGYGETATERNFTSKMLFSLMLNSQRKIEQNLLTEHLKC